VWILYPPPESVACLACGHWTPPRLLTMTCWCCAVNGVTCSRNTFLLPQHIPAPATPPCPCIRSILRTFLLLHHIPAPASHSCPCNTFLLLHHIPAQECCTCKEISSRTQQGGFPGQATCQATCRRWSCPLLHFYGGAVHYCTTTVELSTTALDIPANQTLLSCNIVCGHSCSQSWRPSQSVSVLPRSDPLSKLSNLPAPDTYNTTWRTPVDELQAAREEASTKGTSRAPAKDRPPSAAQEPHSSLCRD